MNQTENHTPNQQHHQQRINPIEFQGTKWNYNGQPVIEICRNGATPTIISTCAIAWWPIGKNWSGTTLDIPITQLTT